MTKFVADHVTKMWYLKLWITSFWTEILHLNFEKIVGKINIQAKGSFGHHVGGVQEYALQHGDQYKSYYFVEKSKCHRISPLNAFPLKCLG